MTKRNKLKKLLEIFQPDAMQVDFSEFDQNVGKLKESLTQKIQAQALDDVNRQLNKFRKSLNFSSIFAAAENLETTVTHKIDGVSERLSAELGEFQKLLTNQEENTQTQISTAASRIDDLTQELQSLTDQKNGEIGGLRDAVDKLLDFGKSTQNSIIDLERKIEKSGSDATNRFKTIEETIEITRKDLTKWINVLPRGGGNANRQINVKSSVMSAKYTDINFVQGTNVTLSTADDNTNKRVNITIAASGGAGGNPAGSDTEIQINNNGNFGAGPGLTFNQNTSVLTASILTVNNFLSSNAQSKAYITIGSANADYIVNGNADNVAFQAAVNAAAGKRIFAFKQDYNFSSVVNLISKTTIEFEPGAKVITSSNSEHNAFRTSLIGTDRATYSSILLINPTIESRRGSGLVFNNADNIRLINPEVYFAGPSTSIRQAVFFQHTQNVWVNNPYIHDFNGNGLSFTDTRFGQIDNPIIDGGVLADDGIDIDFDFLDTSSIMSSDITLNNVIVKNIGQGNGVRIENSNNVVLNGLTASSIWSTNGAGLFINSTGQNVMKNIVATGVNVRDVTDRGVMVQEGTGSSIAGVVINGVNVENSGLNGGTNVRGGIVINAPNVTLDNFNIKGTAKTGTDGAGLVIYQKNNITLGTGTISSCVTGFRFWNGDGLQAYTGIYTEGLVFRQNNTNTVTAALSSVAGASIIGARTLIKGTMEVFDGVAVGQQGSIKGTLELRGRTSGNIIVQTPSTVTSWNLTLPSNDGGAGQYLLTDGNGITQWASVTAIGGSGITRSVSVLSVSSTLADAAITDYVFFPNVGVNLTLPTAVSNSNLYTIKNFSSSSVLVSAAAGEDIDGSTTVLIATNNESLSFISNNSVWGVV